MVKGIPVSIKLCKFLSGQRSTSSPHNLDLCIALMLSNHTLKEASQAGAGAGCHSARCGCKAHITLVLTLSSTGEQEPSVKGL